MLPELSLWKCQRWNQPIQWCTNSSECFPSRRRLPNVTGAIVIALKTRKPQTAPQALMGMSQDIRPYIIPCYTSNSFSSNLFTHKKQMTQIKASEDPEKGGRKKKIKTKKKNQTVDWRDGEMINFLGLCSYPDTLSLLYNHNSSHRHIGRVICVRISRQIRWCWNTASNHTRLPQHQIVSPFYLWITWSVNYVSEHTDLQMIWWPLCWKDIMIIPKCYLWFYKHIQIFPCHDCPYDVTKNNLPVS